MLLSQSSGHVIIWENDDVRVVSLSLEPGAHSEAYQHSNDYIFVPLGDTEVLESAGTSETSHRACAEQSHTPASKAPECEVQAVSPSSISWALRGPEVRLLHGGASHIVFNKDLKPYTAIEIELKEPSLSFLQPRFTLFSDHVTSGHFWNSGSSEIAVVSVPPGGSLTGNSGVESFAFPLWSEGSPSNSVAGAGSSPPSTQAVATREKTGAPRNQTSHPVWVLVITKTKAYGRQTAMNARLLAQDLKSK